MDFFLQNCLAVIDLVVHWEQKSLWLLQTPARRAELLTFTRLLALEKHSFFLIRWSTKKKLKVSFPAIIRNAVRTWDQEGGIFGEPRRMVLVGRCIDGETLRSWVGVKTICLGGSPRLVEKLDHEGWINKTIRGIDRRVQWLLLVSPRALCVWWIRTYSISPAHLARSSSETAGVWCDSQRINCCLRKCFAFDCLLNGWKMNFGTFP